MCSIHNSTRGVEQSSLSCHFPTKQDLSSAVIEHKRELIATRGNRFAGISLDIPFFDGNRTGRKREEMTAPREAAGPEESLSR
jgi:hypothetical protein